MKDTLKRGRCEILQFIHSHIVTFPRHLAYSAQVTIIRNSTDLTKSFLTNSYPMINSYFKIQDLVETIGEPATFLNGASLSETI